MINLFGPSRNIDDYENQKYFDIAATLQQITEQIVVNMANFAHKKTKSDNLCLAGGVFLNCVANSQIVNKTPFKNVFIQPAAGDAGGSIGAALAAYYQKYNNPRSGYVMSSAALGPSFTNNQVLTFLMKNNIVNKKLSSQKLKKFIVDKIYRNKTVAVLNGRMEFGPRALGNRTILANAMNKEMKEYLNNKIKHREWFRPYGIIILKDELNKYFNMRRESPFMLLVGNVKKQYKNQIPSALHVDGTSRIQTITFEGNSFLYELLIEFKKKSGIPLMINTSFNDNGEPVVCTPEDAYRTFVKSPIDYLILENYVICK